MRAGWKNVDAFPRQIMVPVEYQKYSDAEILLEFFLGAAWLSPVMVAFSVVPQFLWFPFLVGWYQCVMAVAHHVRFRSDQGSGRKGEEVHGGISA